MQNVLGYSPLETGVRFLPISLLSFLAAPIAGKFAERLPVRAFLGGGLTLVGIALVLMSGIAPERRLDDPARRLHRRRDRDRLREPAARHGRHLAGAILAFALIRARDFVATHAAAAA